MNNTSVYGGAGPEVSTGLKSTKGGPGFEKNQSRKEMTMLIDAEIEATLQRLEAFRSELRRVTAEEQEEKAFQQHRQLEQLNDVLSENQLLLEKLHEAQEAYERLMKRDELNTQALSQQSSRLRHVLKKFPTHWEVERLEVERLKDERSAEVVQWHIHNAYLGDELIPLIKIKTYCFKSNVEVFIQRTDKQNSNWISWPYSLTDKEVFPCTPIQDHPYQGTNWLLSSLGTSDWKKLKELFKRMASALGKGTNTAVPKNVNARLLGDGLAKLVELLDNWPLSLRYDKVTLTKTIQTEHYRSLGILLSNVSLGEQRWDSLEYNLATVDENGGFGENPRLEFPESTRNVIENWFVESEDGRGLRLELRFAHPQAIDTNVWQLLSDSDQILIAALVSNLSVQLGILEREADNKSLRWTEWQELGNAVREIMVNNMRNHRRTLA
ncbi:hypothetical protein RA263_25855 [Pseudomonas syringae pv. tagetis]|nr:hypothetical protein [Pseudomonas syringae group genomosp. 7]RMW10801.1 hypothetical protein ALO98_200180 [Pseudomonas syringae pv. tagetis]UNB69530.1 hypothetical protein MME58_04595 [Pseudomonas syringae pv. tagetis]